MIALGKHLRGHDEDRAGGLAFRRDCPICRNERVVGTLPDDMIISPTTRVTLALGSLLAGGLMPAGVAMADRGGGSHEGVAIQAPPVPAPPARGASPADDVGAAVAPVVETATSPVPEIEGADRDHLPQLPGRERPPASPGPVASGEDEHASGWDRDGDRAVSTSAAEPAPAPAPPAPAAPPAPGAPDGHAQPQDRAERAAHRVASSAGEDTAATPASSKSKAAANRDTAAEVNAYVVQRGDCLWRIAARQLGEAASDAAIAKEVTRLWKLNAKRIGTGDPDLIHPGQKLVL